MISIGPQRYVSAHGALQNLGDRLEPFGERALVVGNKTALERYEATIRSSLKEAMIGSSIEVSLGESCLPEIERIAEEGRKQESDMVVGLGAGKTLDVVKYAAQMLSQHCVTVPTVASSTASYTNQVYLYSEDGEFLKRESLDTCPDLMLMDYAICGLADPRHLIAGMGTALAQTFPRKLTRSELEVSQPRNIAFDLSRSLRDGLFERGADALEAVERGEVTRDLEAVLDMNVLHAGLIAMLGGRHFRAELAQFLALHLQKYTAGEVLFGEVAAFGLLVQELLRSGDESSLEPLADFYLEIGLPVTYDDLGLPSNQRDTILTDAVEKSLDLYYDVQQDDRSRRSVEEVVELLNRVDRKGMLHRQSG